MYTYLVGVDSPVYCLTKPTSLPVDAPRDRALAMCPTVWMPPSAMTGTPKRLAYSDTLYTAVAWGRPHASTDGVGHGGGGVSKEKRDNEGIVIIHMVRHFTNKVVTL